MIHIDKLVLHNFMSYRDKQVIQLANQGIVRIEGVNEDDQSADSNMAGKSTIIEALLWCFFGRTLRGLKHNQVVNRKTRKNCYVSVTFRAEGKLYVCRRNRKHTKHGNKLLLHRGDVSLSSRHESDTQARLEHILDCDYESFVNSVVFGGFDSGTRKQFALQTDSQQKQLLDSFLKFEKFEIALKRTKHALEEERKASRDVESAVFRLQGQIDSGRTSIRDLRRSSRRMSAEEALRCKSIQAEIESLRSTARKNYSSSKISGNGIENELKQTEDKVEQCVRKKAGAEEKLSGIQRQLNVLAKKQLNILEMIGKPCPTCGREVKENTLSALEKHLRLERRKLKMEKRVAVKAVTEAERRLSYGREVLKRLHKKQKTHFASENRKTQLEERLKAVKENSSSLFLEELESASKQYSKQVSRLLAYQYERQLLKKKIADLEFWETGFGNRGVKTLIVRETLPAMNAKLKEYAQEIFDGNVELEFRPSKETKKGEERELFNLFYNSTRNSDSYVGESSGGRRRIDICVLLVFNWLSRCADILLVDELLDGLDVSGREKVLDILSRQSGTVLVITHNKDFKSKIGNIWTVYKKNGMSRIEAENA